TRLDAGLARATPSAGSPESRLSAAGAGGSRVSRGAPSRLSGTIGSGLQRGAGRPEVLAADHNARRHSRLGLLAPHPRVVLLLVADLAVDLEHALVVAQHVAGHRPGEGVLGVCV